jgi:hypothetical protein
MGVGPQTGTTFASPGLTGTVGTIIPAPTSFAEQPLLPQGIAKKIMIDGYRNAVVRITGVLSPANNSQDLNITSIVSINDFTNNDVMCGTRPGFQGFIMHYIAFAIGNGLELQLQWNGSPPELIVALARTGKIAFDGDGGLVPSLLLAGYDGSINLLSTGYQQQAITGTPQNFYLELGMIKMYL